MDRDEKMELRIRCMQTNMRIMHIRYGDLLEELSMREFLVLMVVADQDKKYGEKMNVSDIAGRIHCSVQSLSRSIRNLEKKKYLERVSDSENRRNTLVYISESGKEIFEHNKRIFKDFMDRVLDRIPPENLSKYIEIQEDLCRIINDEMKKSGKGKTYKEDKNEIS